MSTIYLLRHAEYDNPKGILPGRLPIELSEKGLKQAEKLKSYFADKKIAKIFSSEVVRCQQTSEIISDKKITIEFNKGLLEVLNAYQGYWTEDTSYAYWMRKSLGGELNIDVQNRMVDFWKNACFEDGKNYIVSSHGDPLYFLYQYITGTPLMPEIQFGDKVKMPADYHPLGGIRVIEKENGKWNVKKLVKPEDL